MKVKFKPNDKLEFELEGAGQKEIFKELATVQEIFSEKKCGVCGSENIKFVVRNVEGNDYYELRCMDCGATLAFGQHKKGGTLFPKRKDEKRQLVREWWLAQMAKGQQKVIIIPPVPGTKEYFLSKKNLHVEYKYTQDDISPFKYSIPLYGFMVLVLSLVCTTITVPEPEKPIVLELSFGKPKSEIIETIEVEDLGIESEVISEEVGSTDDVADVEPEPQKIVEQEPKESEPEPPKEPSNFEKYWASIQPEEIQKPEEIGRGPEQAVETIQTMTSSIGQAVSSNYNAAAVAQARYGSGDSMEVRLARAGAQTGKIQVSLFWNTCDDIDLHVVYAPGNGYSDTINWQNRYGKLSGGILDVDMNAQGPHNYKCVENVFWPNNVPRGFFIVKAHFYKSFSNNRRVPIMVRIKIDGKIEVFNSAVILGQSPIIIQRFRY